MQSKVKKPRVIIEAVITRADGTVENLGAIADSKKGTVFEKIIRTVKGNA